MLCIEHILIMSVKPHTVFLIPTDSDSDGLQYDCDPQKCKVLSKISEATNTLSNTSENLVLKGTILQPMMLV